MADLTLTHGHPFPVAQEVDAYTNIGQIRDGEPIGGTIIDTATVQADGSLTFTGLADGGEYLAVAEVSGVWRWVGFQVPDSAALTFEEQFDAVDATIAAHLSDASDAHDASAISFEPTGSLAATNAQDAIAEAAAEGGGGGGEPSGPAGGVLAGSYPDPDFANADLEAIVALTPPNDSIIQRKSGVWVARSMVQVKADLALAKADVGLSSVDNTADDAKPVSSAQQTALDLKAALAGPAFTGNPTAPTQTAGNDSTRLATTAFVAAAVAAGGGAGLTAEFHEVATSQTTASTSYTNLATVGPLVTIPADGDYVVVWGFSGEHSDPTGILYCGLQRGGSAADDANAIINEIAVANDTMSGVRASLYTLTATTVVAAQYKTSGATATFLKRWLFAVKVA